VPAGAVEHQDGVLVFGQGGREPYLEQIRI
jgi:hypothetical protein